MGVRVIRVVCLVDGFNLYHALDALNAPHLKWLDLRAIAARHTLARSEELREVYYFSAYATWLPEARRRHEAYVKALESRGVTAVMGHFKEKARSCRSCKATWKAHEEKETDVNIALYLLRLAYRDEFDRCILVTRDSDLAPAVRTVLADFPEKKVTILCPPERGHSAELLEAAGRQKAKMTRDQLEACQLPDSVFGVDGGLLASRPAAYARWA